MKIGDAFIATRKVKSKIYGNIIIGPVLEVWDNACRIVTNEGTSIESDFQIFFNDWDIDIINF